MSALHTEGADSAARLMIVDDDDEVRGLLVRVLGAEGYVVEDAADASSARRLLAAERYDLVVLDVVLDREDGLELMSSIRAHDDIPVILLTGRGHEADRILGLKMGADDYMVKPFSPAELSARIGSVLRRSRPSAPPARLTFDSLTIDTNSREIRVDGALVELTVKEFDLLSYLAASPRQVLSRDQLLRQVWESSAAWQDPSTVTEHVRRIRRKIEPDPDHPRWIRTIRGIGYRFEP